jgi:hypothetical protein
MVTDQRFPVRQTTAGPQTTCSRFHGLGFGSASSIPFDRSTMVHVFELDPQGYMEANMPGCAPQTADRSVSA